MARWFNTSGICLPDYHYMVPPLRRLPEAPQLIDELGYFVVHAPPADRQDHRDPGARGRWCCSSTRSTRCGVRA